MATDKKQLYNSILLLLGERQIDALDENVESRYILDAVWDEGLVDDCLEEGQWVFATRAVKLEYSPDVTNSFGFQYAFEKPEDFIRTVAVCSDEYFKNPLLAYNEEAGFWFTDLQTIYIKYVSNDANYGNNLSLWPGSFKKYVVAQGAFEASARITQDKEKRKELFSIVEDRKHKANSKDAMADPTKFPPQGSWTSSRRGNSSGRRDGGMRTTLIG